jgi:hypothetical protein
MTSLTCQHIIEHGELKLVQTYLSQIRIRIQSPRQTISHNSPSLFPILAISITLVNNLSHLRFTHIDIDIPLAALLGFHIRYNLHRHHLVVVPAERALELARIPLLPNRVALEASFAVCICCVDHACAICPLAAIVAFDSVFAKVGSLLWRGGRFCGRGSGRFDECGNILDGCHGDTDGLCSLGSETAEAFFLFWVVFGILFDGHGDGTRGTVAASRYRARNGAWRQTCECWPCAWRSSGLGCSKVDLYMGKIDVRWWWQTEKARIIATTSTASSWRIGILRSGGYRWASCATNPALVGPSHWRPGRRRADLNGRCSAILVYFGTGRSRIGASAAWSSAVNNNGCLCPRTDRQRREGQVCLNGPRFRDRDTWVVDRRGI